MRTTARKKPSPPPFAPVPKALTEKLRDAIGMPQVMKFIALRLREFDTSFVEWIKLRPLNQKVILHGRCDYPLPLPSTPHLYRRGYRLRASVNVELPPPYTHMHWGRVPSANHRQGWYSGLTVFEFDSLDECAVHTLAHECFHFLSHSKQIKVKNTEANANWWADRWLKEYIAQRED